MKIEAQNPFPPVQPDIKRWISTSVILLALLVIGIWLWKTPSGISGKADAIGYAICHRIDERSFSAYGRQLPLCARCSGIYSGAMAGLAIIFATGRSRVMRFPKWQIWVVLIGFVGLLGIDGLNSYGHLFPNFDGGIYEPSNTLRVITGVFCGLTLIHALYPVFNATVWRIQDKRSAIANFKELAVYAIGAALAATAILSGSPFLLLIFGLISAFGVLFVLTMVSSVMFITLIRQENTYTHWRQLALPFLAGLTFAIILIGGIDALRYMFTGTWDGFVFAPR